MSYSRSYKSLFYPKGRNSTPRHSWNNRLIICIERQKELYRETILLGENVITNIIFCHIFPWDGLVLCPVLPLCRAISSSGKWLSKWVNFCHIYFWHFRFGTWIRSFRSFQDCILGDMKMRKRPKKKCKLNKIKKCDHSRKTFINVLLW